MYFLQMVMLLTFLLGVSILLSTLVHILRICFQM